ncbi:MAG: DUF2269 family protein [Acidimicrobiia bacterium]|nr:DUF2269 family protein [Acidimicrobiia bacterium]
MTETLAFLHILAAIIGFGGVMLNGLYASKAQKADPREGLAILESNWTATRVSEIAIYLVFVFGLVLAWDLDILDQAWVSISMGLYVVALVVSLAILQPSTRKLVEAQRRLVEGEEGARDERDRIGARLGVAGGVNHLLFVVVLLLMVFKWG